jgi:hypothetical protein
MKMKIKYQYFKSSTLEPKHEITRQEFVKALGESNYCVNTSHIANGLYMDIADYKKAEKLLRKAQRDRTSGTIWCSEGVTLYLEKKCVEEKSKEGKTL